jgi:hypothetical protein
VADFPPHGKGLDRSAGACRALYRPQWFGAVVKLLSNDTRVKWALAVFLALVAGYLDGYFLS